MDKKVQNALERLNQILPLHESQQHSTPQVKQLHQQILHSFVTQGRILTRQEMAEIVEDVPTAVDALRHSDMIAVAANGKPVGAYPFTMEEREHVVAVNGQRVHAMCAVDALAIAPMFQTSTRITSRCTITGTPIEIHMAGEQILNQKDVQQTYVGIDWAAANGATSCAESLCTEMIFLHDQATTEQWLSEGEGREIFTLQEAVQFASQFFVPLLH